MKSTIIYLIATIISTALVSGCNAGEELTVCGPYAAPGSGGEGELLKSTFEGHKKLGLTDVHNYGFNTDFTISDGDYTVFHFVRFWQSEYSDGYYEFHFLFQMENEPEKATVIIEPSQFRDHKVFFRSSNYFSQNGVLKEDDGCIYLKKLNEDEWQVSVSLTYFNIQGAENGRFIGENEVFQLTDTFYRGDVKYNNAKMHFGQ
jgi:hypothetical protein